MKKFADGAFLAAVMLALLACLGRTVFFPKEISAGENRYAGKIEKPTLNSYMDGSFQEGVESALSDQALLSQTARRGYNRVSAGVRELLMSGLYASNKWRYIRLSSTVSLFGDYLVYDTRDPEVLRPSLDRRISEINDLAAAHSERPLYVYYIEKDTDINFETGEKAGLFEYIAGKLNIPAENVARLEINSFDDYAERFYRTDHHWNYIGSYQGYVQVLALLGAGDMIMPVEEITIGPRLSGSKAIESGNKDVYTEEFTAYRFDYPPMSIAINGYPAEDYGSQDDYFAGGDEELSYGSFYGGDFGEVVFDTGRPEKENLLVLGESHDNAILKLLAGSFNRVHAVDLRYYEGQTGAEFDAYKYMADNDIDKVLLIGSIGFFLSEEISLED